MNMKKLSTILLLFLLISCRSDRNVVSVKEVKVKNAAVVTAHPLASEIGLQVIKDGGNAIDAAIAIQFALAVCFPRAGNLGGGGFMLYRDKNGDGYSLDFREMAPKASTEDMYLDSLGNVIKDKSVLGALAVGIPGTVDGMDQMFQRFSKLKDWKRLIQPAVDLAENGFYLTEKQLEGMQASQERFKTINSEETVFTQLPAKGKKFVQKDLAKVLRAIQENGKYGFYSGWVSDNFVSTMQKHGGIITHMDLLRYKSIWRIPSEVYYKKHRILTMPLPASGGVVLPQLFEMIAPYRLAQKGFHTPEAVHLMVEAERRVFADRAMHLGDPRYHKAPLFNLMSDGYLRNRMNDYDPKKASLSSQIREGDFYRSESEETTHFSIVDNEGNAVSLTTTLNGAFGSHLVVEGCGFLLNNEMDDFSIKPGTPNLYGLIGGEANKIQPGKRMLSSMSPTIVDYPGGNLRMVVGTPGGSTILTSVFQVIVNVLDFNMDLKSAVHAPRFHHQWLPDEIRVENGLPDQTITSLKEKGHKIVERGSIGRVEAIHIESDGTITGVADNRMDDHACGY